jgi:hypothetical protein
MAHATENLIHSILVNGTTYEIHDAAAIHTIEDLRLSRVLQFGGIVEKRETLPAASAEQESFVYHVREEDTEVVCVKDGDTYRWEDFGHAIVTDHIHNITITPTSTAEASKLVDAGSVVAGTAPSFTEGTFNPGSFTQGEDKFTAGSFEAGSVSLNCTPASYSQGTDTFAPNTPTKLDLTKFNAGSASLVDGSYTAPTASFKQGTDSFSANTPTVVDVSKFNAGSASVTAINYVAPQLTPCQVSQSVENGVLSFSFTAGSLTSGSVSGAELTYVAPSLETGFYKPGTAATFVQGQDEHTFNAGAYSAPTLSYTAPSIAAGFWTEGSAAQFTQGTDTFNPGNCSISETAAKWTAPTFEQGKDTYVAPTKAADSFNAGTHTQVTLPTFTTVSNLWTGASATCGKPEQA